MKLLVLLILFSSFSAYSVCDEHFQRQLDALSIDIDKTQLLLSIKKVLNKKLEDPTKFQKEIFDLLFKLEKSHELESSLSEVVKLVRSSEYGVHIEKLSDEMIIAQLSTIIRAELYGRGYYSAFKFQSWKEIALRNEAVLNTVPNVDSFLSPYFQTVFKALSGHKFHDYEKIQLLSDAQSALEKRIKLIREAQEKIHLIVWGFYDDSAGKLIADELIAAYKKKVDVKIIVDGLTARRAGYHQELERMQRAGISLIKWESQENPYFGNHVKMLLVDDKYTIEGGRNIGTDYLGQNQWSDLDLYYQDGTLAEIENPNIFARMWNQQNAQQKLNYLNVGLKKSKWSANAKIATIVNIPSEKSLDRIYLMKLYAIKNAKNEIDIANAYIISTPQMKAALIAAIERGVKVRIYTNSSLSVDEPIVSIPIMKSVLELQKEGAQVFLKKGKTLHTKMMRVDDLVMVETYNMHPRSTRYEVEKSTVITDRNMANEMKILFDNEVNSAHELNNADEFNIPESAELDFFFSLIFDQL